MPATISRKQQLTGYCACGGCKPASAKSRANAAIRMLLTQRHLGRPFEHAFECSDADDVVREVTRQAYANRALEKRLRECGYGYWLDPFTYAHLWTEEIHPFARGC